MSRRRRRIPQELVESEIIDLSHAGKGIAKIGGKTVFVSGALPGERVSFKYIKVKRSYDEAMAQEILSASPNRVKPKCDFFNICGGCALQHLAVGAQISYKQNILLEQFSRIGKVKVANILEPIVDREFGYRRKARLGVRNVPKKGGVLVGFREKSSSFITVMDSCKTLHPKVGNNILALKELVGSMQAADKIAQIEVALSEDDNCILVFRNLVEIGFEDRKLLDEFGIKQDFNIYLQPKGMDSVEPLNERHQTQLSYQAENMKLEFAPTDFTQVNFGINVKMLKQALELLDLKPEDKVLDLFCGIGNFSLPIARRTAQVLGVEQSPEMVRKAYHNAEINQVENANFTAVDLQSNKINEPWLKQKWDKVLLDPPRSGAQEIIPLLEKVAAKLIVYVSCNPATLARDANILVNDLGYKLVCAGVIDMFPHTAHVESIALFSKN